MYDDEDLDEAVAAGVLSASAVAAFRAHADDRRRGTGDADDERFHLLTGFNDIFVVIAGVLLLLAVGWLGSRVAPWVGALAVSALGYVLYAFTSLLNDAGFVGTGFAITALLIGGALLVLSAFWHRSRQALVSRLPDTLRARLAPLH